MLGLPVLFTPLLSKVCGKRKKRTAVGGCLFWGGLRSKGFRAGSCSAHPVGCLGCIPTIFLRGTHPAHAHRKHAAIGANFERAVRQKAKGEYEPQESSCLTVDIAGLMQCSPSFYFLSWTPTVAYYLPYSTALYLPYLPGLLFAGLSVPVSPPACPLCGLICQ